MGVRHAELPIEGVQFHPESILSEHGHAMLRNFLEAMTRMKPRSTCAATPSRGPPPPCATRCCARRLGDDVFGDDPTVNALQERIAAELASRRRCSCPPARRAICAALMSHCQRGDEYLVGQMAHTYRWEGGGAAVLGSIQPQPLPNQPDGSLALADIEAAIKPDDAHFARTPSACLENTWAARCCRWPTSKRRPRWRVRAAWRRTWTARGSSTPRWPRGVPAREIARHFDSVSVCFSKGLGAPVGSALCGSRDLIARAHRWRKMAGGAMRQAACWPPRRCTRSITMSSAWPTTTRMRGASPTGLEGLAGVRVEPPQTNIVFVDLAPEHGASVVERLRARGVLCTGLYRLRFVTHLDVTRGDIERAIAILRDIARRRAGDDRSPTPKR